jgi:tRNA A37 threonylcarbamoyladenosine synthetase subunit TsaC/SUA5/YrdC
MAAAGEAVDLKDGDIIVFGTETKVAVQVRGVDRCAVERLSEALASPLSFMLDACTCPPPPKKK